MFSMAITEIGITPRTTAHKIYIFLTRFKTLSRLAFVVISVVLREGVYHAPKKIFACKTRNLHFCYLCPLRPRGGGAFNITQLFFIIIFKSFKIFFSAHMMNRNLVKRALIRMYYYYIILEIPLNYM